jgi:glutaredoxin
VSVDSIPSLKAWAESLGGIDFPLLSDFWPHGYVALQYGVLRSEGFSERAIFIIDAEGFVRFADVYDMDSQPDNEVLFAELEKIAAGVPPIAEESIGASAAAAPVPVAQDAGTAAEPSAPGDQAPPRTSKIVMYCASWCPDCRRAKALLDRLGTEREEIDIDDVPGARAKCAELNEGRVVTPTFVIDGVVWANPDPKALEDLISGR